MGKNIQRLGETLSQRMIKSARAAVPVALELGIINSNLSLTVDSIKVPIPKGEYMVSLTLTGTFMTSVEVHNHSGGTHGGHTSGTGYHTHDDGAHNHRLPMEFRSLLPGDRVLVVWCGNEPVVVDILVSS